MSNQAYSDRQIEAANLLRSVGEGTVPDGVITEIVEMLKEKDEAPADSAAASQTETLLRLAIMQEPDWRKKAQLNALLISRSLE